MCGQNIFPIYVYDLSTSTVKLCARDHFQGFITANIFTIWAHSLILMYSRDIYWVAMLLAAVSQCVFQIYGFNITSNSLKLRKDLFENMSLKDVIKCLVTSIGSLESTEGHLRASMDELHDEELLRVLKLFFNRAQWEQLRTQQMKELGILSSFFMRSPTLDLSGDPDLATAARSLERVSGRRAEYADRLLNFEMVEERIARKKRNLEALKASFTIHVTAYSAMLKDRKLPGENRQPTKLSLDSNKMLYKDEEKLPPIESKSEHFEIADKPEWVPSNVKYDPNSFYDREFPKSEFADCCVWLRARDIPPTTKEVALFSDPSEAPSFYAEDVIR